MDADFSTRLGESLNARRETYRLTHGDPTGPGTAPTPPLTGADTGSNRALTNGSTPRATPPAAPEPVLRRAYTGRNDTIPGTPVSRGLTGANGSDPTPGFTGLNGSDLSSGFTGLNGSDVSSGFTGVNGSDVSSSSTGSNGGGPASGSTGVNSADLVSGYADTNSGDPFRGYGNPVASGYPSVNRVDSASAYPGVNGFDSSSADSSVNGADSAASFGYRSLAEQSHPVPRLSPPPAALPTRTPGEFAPISYAPIGESASTATGSAPASDPTFNTSRDFSIPPAISPAAAPPATASPTDSDSYLPPADSSSSSYRSLLDSVAAGLMSSDDPETVSARMESALAAHRSRHESTVAPDPDFTIAPSGLTSASAAADPVDSTPSLSLPTVDTAAAAPRAASDTESRRAAGSLPSPRRVAAGTASAPRIATAELELTASLPPADLAAGSRLLSVAAQSGRPGERADVELGGASSAAGQSEPQTAELDLRRGLSATTPDSNEAERPAALPGLPSRGKRAAVEPAEEAASLGTPADARPAPALEPLGSHSAPEPVSAPDAEAAETFSSSRAVASEPRRDAPESETSPDRTGESELSSERLVSESAAVPRRAAGDPPRTRRAARESARAQENSTPPPSLTEFREPGSASIGLPEIMRLLVASQDLEAAALQAEAGDITVSELARAARRTRHAAVDLVTAWYGGADQMRVFGEMLLRAAGETA
ncbi:hypothetical protein [Nocardia inohanensis]|uniref:hypothetical protein n=1 Tax=Nocardia inohanensis TaxID=209246 RepID=UPI0012FB72BD|nr:hypothetical protein [Nocardia inohanensis]